MSGINKRELELKLVGRLPDNGVRESALFQLKKKWEKEDEGGFGICLGIIIVLAITFFSGYRTGIWNEQVNTDKRIEAVHQKLMQNKNVDSLMYSIIIDRLDDVRAH